MAPDMSGYANDPQAWMRDSGGTMADYHREMAAWRASMQPTQTQPQTQAQSQPTNNTPAQTPNAPAQTPQWNHRESATMQANYDRLVADGVPPAEAERIVRTAIGGLPHDYERNYAFDATGQFDAGTPAEDVVNQYRQWEKWRDPSCPPDAPYKGEHTGRGCWEHPTDDQYEKGAPREGWDKRVQGGGGGQGGSGGGAAGGGGGMGATGEPIDPLQQALIDRFQGREGMFQGGASGQDLAGGGVFWQGDQPQGPGVGGVAATLLDATLNAFTPNAPSQRSSPQPAAPAQMSQVSGVLQQAIGAAPANTVTPGGTAGISPAKENLDPAIKYRFKDPNAWWADESTKSRGGSVQRLA